MKKILGLLMLFMFAAVMSYAAESTSANGTAKAKIIEAATITHQDGALDFGTIFQNSTGGTVTVTAAASPARTPSNVTVAAGDPFSADHFLMEHLATGTTYAVSLAATPITITRQGGSEEMSVALNLSDSSVSSVTQKDIYVGGVLTVGPQQAVGQYEGSYTVNVTY